MRGLAGAGGGCGGRCRWQVLEAGDTGEHGCLSHGWAQAYGFIHFSPFFLATSALVAVDMATEVLTSPLSSVAKGLTRPQSPGTHYTEHIAVGCLDVSPKPPGQRPKPEKEPQQPPPLTVHGDQ